MKRLTEQQFERPLRTWVYAQVGAQDRVMTEVWCPRGSVFDVKMNTDTRGAALRRAVDNAAIAALMAAPPAAAAPATSAQGKQAA